ncbi:hypothetical protein AVEN_265635-1 [Araneus ventricosus]|uniref:Uncharacterized protein n=1 Tax=Araneus ventricosus TaxID=182803 RepID=A0A4Y2GEC0_ARAVE|nr:hypothetical protein AVEN_265635-1 [Araneus ventricosus]
MPHFSFITIPWLMTCLDMMDKWPVSPEERFPERPHPHILELKSNFYLRSYAPRSLRPPEAVTPPLYHKSLAHGLG